MFLVVSLAYALVAILIDRAWSLAFLIPFAAIPGGLMFHHLVHAPPSRVDPGWPEALVWLLWGITTFAFFDFLVAELQGQSLYARVRLRESWIAEFLFSICGRRGIPLMTLAATSALLASAWNRRVAAGLACLGLAVAAGYVAFFYVMRKTL